MEAWPHVVKRYQAGPEGNAVPRTGLQHSGDNLSGWGPGGQPRPIHSAEPGSGPPQEFLELLMEEGEFGVLSIPQA